MAGVPPETRPRAFPPVDSGVMGPEPDPTNLTVIVSVGASLFDDRYGLADRKPRELITMPFMANDRLDPEQSHGDILLTVAAARPDAVAFAIRQLMRATRRTLILHWTLEGFTRRDQPDRPPGTTQFRNLMGFKDGSANLDASVPELMDRFVWVQPDDDEPDWCVGGSYHAFRTIRMFVEFWDRTPLSEQEAIMGRHRASGAPLGQDNESDPPDFADDPDGDVIPLDAHIRLANPRTPETDENLILRRGFSFSRGFDDAGRLDQGLAFVSYQRSLERGFIAVQNRLSGEPLEEYILPVGGGFFFALPGVTTEDGFLGEGLVA
jgi:deferrochelatase/peroxidase EfeB